VDKDVVVLQRWSVCNSSNGYNPPESWSWYLQGRVYGHPDPRFDDGVSIVTSRVLSVDGRKVTCRSRTYKLGRIHPKYRQWLKDNGYDYNPHQPVTVKEVPRG
jgi:hypothetical protein